MQIKFDFIQNLEKQKEEAPEEELRLYKENPDKFIKLGVEKIKTKLKNDFNYDDYCWTENLDVKVVEEWEYLVYKMKNLKKCRWV